MVHRKIDKKGFTFVELMVVLALSSIVMASIYSVFRAQLRSHVTQQVVVEMQQNVRNAMIYLQRSIRMAGYDPLGSAGAAFVADFDTDFHSAHIGQVANADTDSTIIALTVDEDGDGRIDHCTSVETGCLAIDDNINNELIAYRLNNGDLQIYRGAVQSWEVVGENLVSINFIYLDPAGNATTDLAQVRSVEITIVAQSDDNPMVVRGDMRRNRLTAIVHCRNLMF